MMGDFVDYTALRLSDLYKEFQQSTNQLVRVDLDSYTDAQRKAFFISMLSSFPTVCMQSRVTGAGNCKGLVTGVLSRGSAGLP